MTIDLSVVIPAHNPRLSSLARVLEALRSQSLDQSRWELVLVDNCSEPPLQQRVDISWHPNGAVYREEKLGLVHARSRGFLESVGPIVVIVDDDNVLDLDYLEKVLALASEYPFLGTWSGGVRPEFEDPTFTLNEQFMSLLTLRQVDGNVWSNDPSHSSSTPWGAGMCVRRSVFMAYLDELARTPERAALDIQGRRHLSGGDTDIAYIGCTMGLGKGIFARLRLTHLIPRERCSLSYLCEVSHGRGYSQVLHSYISSGTLSREKTLDIGRFFRLLKLLTKSSAERSIVRAHRRGEREARRHLAT